MPGLGDSGHTFDANTSMFTLHDGYGREAHMKFSDGSGCNLLAKENLPGIIPTPPSAEIYAGGKTYKLTSGNRTSIKFRTRDGKQRRITALWTPPKTRKK